MGERSGDETRTVENRRGETRGKENRVRDVLTTEY